MDEGPARMYSENRRKRPGGTEWDNMGRESRFLANRGKLQLRWNANLGQNGTAVGKFCPVQTSNCPPRVRHSRIAVLDSRAATKSLQPVATDLHRQGNRVLNAGGPISRHSRACGNPNPRLPSHQELKRNRHSHLHRHSDQFCVLRNKTRLPWASATSAASRNLAGKPCTGRCIPAVRPTQARPGSRFERAARG